MALHLPPGPAEPGDSERTEHVDERQAEAKQLVRDGMQVLAHGAMVCPSCAMPIAPPPRIKPRAGMRCGWCRQAAPAHEFVRGEVRDTPANDVRVVARIV